MDPQQEIILSQNIRLSNDSYHHQRNLHTVVIGDSGSGKTRFFVKGNVPQCSGSYFFLDPNTLYNSADFATTQEWVHSAVGHTAP